MAITLVQAAGNNISAVPSPFFSLSTTIALPGASNQLVVCVASDAVNTAIVMNALTGQAWTKLPSPPSTDGGAATPDLAVFVSTSPGTSTTVTVQVGSTVPCEMVVLELAGTANGTTTDGASVSTTGAVSTTVTPAAIHPATAGCIGITTCATDSSQSILSVAAGAEGGSWTIPTGGAQPNGSGVERMTLAYQIFATAPASVQPVWTTASTNTQFANLFCLRPLLAGGRRPFNPIPFMR